MKQRRELTPSQSEKIEGIKRQLMELSAACDKVARTISKLDDELGLGAELHGAVYYADDAAYDLRRSCQNLVRVLQDEGFKVYIEIKDN